MFKLKTSGKTQELEAIIAAIGRSQATIEFGLDGTILTANAKFLEAMGYTLAEIQGKHHSMFVEPSYRDGQEYRAFWARLRAGSHETAEYKRIGKGGRMVWIQASYNPILDASGRPFKVIKFATDVTQQKLSNADYQGQIDAIGKSQAVIEFGLDGTILTANAKFLEAMGYTLAEVQGKHHSMFVSEAYRESDAYRDFWASLRRGEYQAAEYQRLGKGGREVWIQATYNPILGLDGKPFKVTKFATDITRQVSARSRVSAMLQSIASGSEQLNASICEIAMSMVKSKDTADGASTKAESADGAARKLTEVAKSMNRIVVTIGGITEQINLLALNATIESARAGSAGRGFGVVANEVKILAGQAKTATDQIAKEIESMRAVFTDVTSGLEQIKLSIGNVREYVTATAAAVEEQTAVVKEMSSTLQQTAMEALALA